jgi:hypothetical protein
MTGRNKGLEDRLARFRQIKLGVVARKTGSTISFPVWFVLAGDKFYLQQVRGSDTGISSRILRSAWMHGAQKESSARCRSRERHL